MFFKSKPNKSLIAKNEKFSAFICNYLKTNALIIECPSFPSIRNKNYEPIITIEKYFTNIVEKIKENNNYTYYYGSIIYYRKGNNISDNDNTFLSELVNIMKRKRIISDDLATSFSIICIADKLDNSNNCNNSDKIIIIDKNRKPLDKNIKKIMTLL